MTAPPREYYRDDQVTLWLGDALETLRTLPDGTVDAVVTDPPYGLEFMGTDWDAPWRTGNGFRRAANPADAGRNTAFGRASRTSPEYVAGAGYQQWCQQWAAECLRVLKPGGHLAAFGAPRTCHRLACGIEDAGFGIRDSLHWVYGSGFPKGKAQLKPAHEPILLSRRPLAGTVAANVLEHGTGALNIDGCRVAPTGESRQRVGEETQSRRYADRGGTDFAPLPGGRGGAPEGRWPTNLVLTHPPIIGADGEPVGDACADGCVPGCPVAEMDAQSGVTRSSGGRGPLSGRPGQAVYGTYTQRAGAHAGGLGDTDGASRFFPVFRYEAKAPASERPRLPDGTAHPTVKPLALMQWLVRLVTPPGGLILDPFAGTGTTLGAALLEGMRAVGVERHEPYAELARGRLRRPMAPVLFGDLS